jgi:OOP family OmpA-OmpF porin
MRFFSVFSAVLLLAAFLGMPTLVQAGPFGGWYDEDSAKGEKPAGMAFHQNLYVEYMKLSKDRDRGMGDGVDAELFNHKALLASTRSAVQNDSVDDRVLTDAQRPEFVAGVDRLRSLYDRGGRDLAPVETAVAQVSFDCWIEATEGKREKDAADCKNKFLNALAAGEAKANRELGQVKIDVAQPAPAPVEVPPQEYYRVPFEFDKTKMTPEGESVLAQAIKDVKDLTTLKIALRAHADRSGNDDYNLKLSKRRAEAILNRMAAAGISQDRLRIVEAVGESRPLVPTADGVKNPANRIVEIDLRQ